MDQFTRTNLNRTQNIAIIAIMAALYAALTIVLGQLSYGPLNLRVADTLLPFPYILGWPMAIALSGGCVVANFFGGLGPIDIVFGSLFNLIAAGLVANRKTCPHWILAWVYPTFIIGLGVPIYLSGLLFMPYWILASEMLLSTGVWSALGIVVMQAVQRALPQIFKAPIK